MPFGYNMNKVHATKKEDFIEKKSNSDKQKTKTNKSAKSDVGNRFRVKSYTKDKNPKKYNSDKSDMSDMSFYHKPWHQLTPAQRSARSDMDSIMDY
mgnify:CR=1 FL=1